MSCRFTADTAFFSRTANLPNSTSFTMLAWAVQFVDTNSFATIVSLDSGADAFTIEAANDGTTIGLHEPGVTDVAFAVQPVIREPFCVAITCDGTTSFGYLRRAGDARWDTVTGGNGGAFTPAGMSVGNFRGTPTGNGFRGAMWNFKVWDRVLTPAQLMVESQVNYLVDARDANLFWRLKHPGDLVDYGPHAQRRPTRNGTPQASGWCPRSVGLLNNYRPAIRKVDAAATNAFTLTITAGVYALAGQSINLRATRALVITQGTYAYTGKNVGLAFGHNLAITKGTYQLVGNSINLSATRSIVITKGVYQLVGNNVGLAFGHNLAITKGAYQFVGNSINLSVTRSLTIQQGQYQLVGNNVNLSAARTLTTTVGRYSLVGNDVLLSAANAKVIQPTQGVYSLIGNGVNLSATRSLVVTAGRYSLVGNDVLLSVGRSLQPETGRYTLIGNDVVLRTARSLTVQAGIYSLVGQSVDLTVVTANQLVIDQGRYELTGHNVELTVGRVPTPPPAFDSDPRFGGVRFKPIKRRKDEPPELAVAEPEKPAPPPPAPVPKRRGVLAGMLDSIESPIATAPRPSLAAPAPQERRVQPAVAVAPKPKPIDYERVITALQSGWEDERAALTDEIDGMKAKLATAQALIEAMNTQQRVERETNESNAKARQRRRNAVLAAETAARLLLEDD